MKEDEMGEEHSIHGRGEKCMQNVMEPLVTTLKVSPPSQLVRDGDT
jgi:hypothetical protein